MAVPETTAVVKPIHEQQRRAFITSFSVTVLDPAMIILIIEDDSYGIRDRRFCCADVFNVPENSLEATTLYPDERIGMKGSDIMSIS